MTKELDSLLYAVRQLLSDVESSESGRRGAHKSQMTIVRRCMDKVENEGPLVTTAKGLACVEAKQDGVYDQHLGAVER